jgi:hypothetical protein
MNRYPLWKNMLVLVALVLGFIYTLPNFYGEAPAVQVLPLRSNLKADPALLARVQDALKSAQLTPDAMSLDATSVTRFADTDTQLKAWMCCTRSSATTHYQPNPQAFPTWLTSMNALPMYRSRPARRSAFPAADRHESRAGQGAGIGLWRYAQHLARSEHSLFRREPRRQRDRRQVPRCRCTQQG